VMTRAELLALPAAVDVPTAARALNVSRAQAYLLIRHDRWPTPVVRMGRLIKIPTAPILDLLGIDPNKAPTVPAPRRPPEQEAG
jgi:hypothetical protein